ncbi:hypothetical protein [Caulobacter sp.]|uniref:hypothetical protein n=1 Tax=Caulobacter sp. TaxID=78 RepID=UPI003BB1864B
MEKSFKLKIALAGAGLLASIALPLAAVAFPKNGWEHYYYTDASHTMEAGQQTMYCNGKMAMQWGEITPYYDVELIDCHDPVDPPNYWP